MFSWGRERIRCELMIEKQNYHPHASQFDQHDQKKGIKSVKWIPSALAWFGQGWCRVLALRVGI
jgi:hypothetical protein